MSNPGSALLEKRELIAKDITQLFTLHAVCVQPVHLYVLALCILVQYINYSHSYVHVVSYFCVCLVDNSCSMSTHPHLTNLKLHLHTHTSLRWRPECGQRMGRSSGYSLRCSPTTPTTTGKPAVFV